MKFYFYIFFIILLYSCSSSQDYIGYTNGYENEKNGITTFSLNRKTGLIKKIAFTPSIEMRFMTMSKNKEKMYLLGTKKNRKAYISYLSVKNSIPKNDYSIPINIKGPCHISLDQKEKYLATSSYSDGSLTTWKINNNRKKTQPIETIKVKGSSIHPDRQKKSHLHSSFFSNDNKFLLFCDLGTDQVFSYNFLEGKLTNPTIYKTNLGGGPRHLAFDKANNYVYILNELSSQIEVCSFNKKNGQLSRIQTISTLPKNFKGKNTSAEILIHPNGKTLYASNRGHDSIAVFTISAQKGSLSLHQHQKTFGERPRNFNISSNGKMMLVGNRKTKQLVSFSIDETTGGLKLLKINKWNCQIMRISFAKRN